MKKIRKCKISYSRKCQRLPKIEVLYYQYPVIYLFFFWNQRILSYNKKKRKHYLKVSYIQILSNTLGEKYLRYIDYLKRLLLICLYNRHLKKPLADGINQAIRLLKYMEIH